MSNVYSDEKDGKMYEPFEDVQIDVPEEFVGSVIEALGNREGVMENMTSSENQVKFSKNKDYV